MTNPVGNGEDAGRDDEGQMYGHEPEELAVAQVSDGVGPLTVDADQIVGWLSESDQTSSGNASSDTTCGTCGYTGMMDRDPERGGEICPACQAAYRRTLSQLTRTVDCPQCGIPLMLSDKDRGKTTVCPGCKSFLGCIWPVERPKRRLFG